MNSFDLLSVLGIAQRGRRLLSGQNLVERAMNDGRIFLVIISEDASSNSKDRFLSLSSRFDIPSFVWGNSRDTGRALGKDMRTVVGITDKNFAREIAKRLNFLMGVGDIDKDTRI